ncbi:MAG: radical SAM protein, partial [Planctomycetes bacterium]|nr:radical SAM protein [Planctomycetota bacterium]
MNESKWMRFLCRFAARYYLRKPDQAELLLIKHPFFSDLWPALRNEAAFRLRRDRSCRLVALNVELTNRCNLNCTHCLRVGSGSRPPRDMDFETFCRIIDHTPGLRTLLPFQWGEPLMSPILYEAIAYASQRKIRVMVTTNGTLLDESACKALLDAGLTRLTISFDGGMETHRTIRGSSPEEIVATVKRFKT